MEPVSEAKSARLLTIYARLLSGRVLQKAELAEEFGVTERSIQRDVSALRCFLMEQELAQDVVYDRDQRGYRLTRAMPRSLTNSEILAVCTTGAYNYSMASNYNRVPRPPIVMLGEGGDYLAVRRETLDDIVSMDV